MKRGLWAALVVGCVLGLMACDSPSDVIFTRPPFAPIEEQPGFYRLTSGTGQDVARRFTPDGRLLFRAFDLPPFGRDWILASVPLSGGQVREEAGVYGRALLDDLSDLEDDGSRRALVLWKAAIPGIYGCPDSSLTTLGSPGPAPRTPTPIGLSIYALPAVDGTPVAALRSRFVSANVVEGAGSLDQRVRVSPAVRDADRTGSNPFGPVLVPGTPDIVYSDGQQLWRAPLADSSTAPTLIGDGAYPVLMPDGVRLVYARPSGFDSTVRVFTIPLGIAFCVEEHVEVSASRWDIVIRDLGTGEETMVAEGLDPTVEPSGARLVVRRSSGLSWVDLSSGSVTPVTGTSGGFSPLVSPDGTSLVFSRLNGPGNADIYFVPITR